MPIVLLYDWSLDIHIVMLDDSGYIIYKWSYYMTLDMRMSYKLQEESESKEQF